MKTFARILTLSCATVALADVDGYAQSAMARSQGAAPAASQAPTLEGAVHLSPRATAEADRLLELRRQAILSQLPDVTAVRLDEHGVPVAQMDLYFGGDMPLDDALLLAHLEEFDFGEAEPGDKPRDQAHGRTLLLPSGVAPTTPADLVSFDPQADLVIEFRRLSSPTEISCSGGLTVNYNGTKSIGTEWFWYAMADMVSASVGPQKLSSADPDIYLANGGLIAFANWTPAGASESASLIDSVSNVQYICVSVYWQIKVSMYVGGAISLRVHVFNAQS